MPRAVLVQAETWPLPSTGLTGGEWVDSLAAAGGIYWEAAAFSAVENLIKLLLNSFLFGFFPCP